MVKIQGLYNTAVCYTPELEELAARQIQAVCDQVEFAGCKIRIMPDVHAGKGCTIGTTMTIQDKIVPGMVGVDIGCGMETVELAERNIDFHKLDKLIRREISFGREVRTTPHPLNSEIDLTQLRCAEYVDLHRARHSIGSLGGGNHFIEVDVDDDGNNYLVIHSGSRNLGKQVADYYQRLAFERHYGSREEFANRRNQIIRELKEQGREKEIGEALAALEKERSSREREIQWDITPKQLCYLTGQDRLDYLHDMQICQRYATRNRRIMTGVIVDAMDWNCLDFFETVHNYIDMESNIVRKGAVSARAGEVLLIPMNMRDGSLICLGKGNDDWNQSAPHGAGRLMGRREAKEKLSVEDFKQTMNGVYTTSVSAYTLDEAPDAYKPMDAIVHLISDTVEVLNIIRPVYNFKAAE